MSKTQSLTQLFEYWIKITNNPPNDFYADGIINEKLYESCNLGHKILIVAKEPNARNHDQNGDRSFVTEWDNKKADYHFARRIGEWVYGIINDFPTYDEALKADVYEYLRRISFMNVKKSGGSGFANRKDIYGLVRETKNVIIQEIEIIDPDIIILGLSFDEGLIKEIFGELDWKMTGYSVNIAKFGHSKIIDFYHPSSRNAGAASYCLLQNVFHSKIFRGL